MVPSNDYELLDFGDGRKLERFGQYTFDRPAPQALDQRRNVEAWRLADARFESNASGQRGDWSGKLTDETVWTLVCESLTFQLRLTRFGQVGFFPEQAEIWKWLGRASQAIGDRRWKILNLFAYTGGSTLAAAQAGAEVVHVDASRTAVTWARRNAEQSNLSAAPIRWIVDDALAFVRRELRRGNRYDGLILDPPSFGRGTQGQVWSIEKNFDELLESCATLVDNRPKLFVVTCHTTGWSPNQLSQRVQRSLQPHVDQIIEHDWLQLATRSNWILKSGTFARWAQRDAPAQSL
jgi:23S rRNA (cytosine1962-C5)-methyltransferase